MPVLDGNHEALAAVSDREPERDSTMIVLIVEPGKEPYAKEIGSGLESLQHEVGGYIQAVYNFKEPVAIVCNDEAKLERLPLNRALRDEDGDIYDIIAGTFMVVGLTEDSFGSLSPELLEQFTEHFKVPEQFAMLGDKIIAIPMISKEQQKHQAAEQKDFEANPVSSGLSVAGCIGTWHTIDHKEIDGHTFRLMGHDTYGDEAACIIVDENGRLSLANVYGGFDEHTVDLLRQEIMPVERMPDDSISVNDMKAYGYCWGGMLPMKEEAAAEAMKSCTVYRLYGDDSEGMVRNTEELKAHAAQGGIFGVEKLDWIAALERQNPLRAAEMSMEDDYGMIDGVINNGPKEKEAKSPDKGGKSSIMERLKADRHQDEFTPHKDKRKERDL